MIGIFKYTAKKDMVLGISDQQTGAKAVILPASSPLNKILWSVDDRTGEIVLCYGQLQPRHEPGESDYSFRI